MGRPPADESDEVLDISPSKLERGSASESEAPPPSYRTRPSTRAAEPRAEVWKNEGVDAHWCFVFSAVFFSILLALAIGLGVALTQRAHRRAASGQ